MGSVSFTNFLSLLQISRVYSSVNGQNQISRVYSSANCTQQLNRRLGRRKSSVSSDGLGSRRNWCSFASLAATGANVSNSIPFQPRNGTYTVGDFMTKKEKLHVVKITTSIDEALELLVENRVSGLPVIDDDWNLVGVVSDYDLLALDSISGSGHSDVSIFPDVDSSWKTFNRIQKLLSKTYGKVVGDLMTPAPIVVRETTNLEDAVRLLLETKFRRLPVVDANGKLAGILTRGNVVGAALQIKRAAERDSYST